MSDHVQNTVYVLQVEHLDSEPSFSNPENNLRDHFPASGGVWYTLLNSNSVQILFVFKLKKNHSCFLQTFLFPLYLAYLVLAEQG